VLQKPHLPRRQAAFVGLFLVVVSMFVSTYCMGVVRGASMEPTYQDGQVVDESSRNISATGDDFTEFHISKPTGWPKGKYTVQILLNGAPVESEEFQVK